MIFATDHDVGQKIMLSLFEGAEGAVDQMVKLSKIHREIEKNPGQGSLFEPSELVASSAGERSTLGEPTEPLRYHRSWDRDQRA